MKRAEKKIKDKDLDALWGQILHSKGSCEYCYRSDSLNAHHIFSRSNKSVRWDLDNGILLCVGHHVFGNFSAHKNPIEFIEFVKNKRGKAWYDRLRKKAQKTVKCDQLYRKKIEIILKDELDQLSNNKLN